MTSKAFEAFVKSAKDIAKDKPAHDFLRSIYDTAQTDCAGLLSPAVLAKTAGGLWDLTAGFKPGEPRLSFDVKTINDVQGQPLDVINVVTTDKPFLVVSLTGEIAARGITIKALFHPIIDGLSLIQIIVARQTPRTIKALRQCLTNILDDISIVTQDFDALQAAMRETRSRLASNNGKAKTEVAAEALAFLDWLHAENFVFLGARTYDFKNLKDAGDGKVEPKIIEGSNLGLLRDKDLQILRDASEPTRVSPQGRVLFDEPDPVVIAKSNLQSRIHRRVRMDYISVKIYGEGSEIIGETRFIGLLTAEAYNLPVKDVPLLRSKAAQVKSRAQLPVGSHAAKTLDFVISSYPRDELFQISEDDLLRISGAIVHLLDRPRTRIFVRRDRYDRFVSVLVYVPREQYSTALRARIGEHLRAAYGGRISAFYPHYADEPIARVHFIIGVSAFDHPEPDEDDLEAEIAALAEPWDSALDMAADASNNPEIINALSGYSGAFNVAYQSAFSADDALADIEVLETLSADHAVGVRAYQRRDDDRQTLRAKFYRYGTRLELSDVMPVFSNFGLHVIEETGYPVRGAKGSASRDVIWVHDFHMRLAFEPDDQEGLKSVFESAFMAVFLGHNDDDHFNSLILPQAVHWRQIAALRALCRYRAQTGLDPSQDQQIAALKTHPDITKMLLTLWSVRFDPSVMGDDIAARAAECGQISKDIETGLNAVTSLDFDRVLRRLLALIMAVKRTSFYQRTEKGERLPRISFKVACPELEDLPAPKPYREIFVWAPHVEGLHLRFGAVARGGLRWSDRRDDYRTEVLGLVKAQQVKNAVIVPVGSKGGFYPKTIPSDASRETRGEMGVVAYKTFIRGLLDITDNYVGEDIVAPDNVICWDSPDPYLVVAADKGTATFSDIANGISLETGFWLGDAFASGGSVGYDHKKMGITARGGWEAVKRHFRELGKDIQTEDFEVIGVGDMSGDVFGNGMLLSKHIRLRAAFNHLDIFIDPDPDSAESFKERARLFALPRSTWQDYDSAKISKGGGVFSRSLKSITLSDEMKAMTGLTQDAVTPNALMHALLKSPTDLLWFGGIGTYIKASYETDAQAGDKANDAIRVNGAELKTKVIGEGANLGLTQAGRIEFARKGGAVNTDAIDNSAGVDSSDHEVNIKILIGGAIERGSLKAKDREPLLAKMTDDVAHLVLAHNYDQTQALSLAAFTAAADHEAYERLMVSLEGEGRLSRQVEGLPSRETMRAGDHRLTRPELAVLLAYAKIYAFDDLIVGGAARDPYMEDLLLRYFPKDLAKFETAMAKHRLRDEIICSRLSNLMVDVGGPLFLLRAQERTGASVAVIAKSFMVAYDVLDIEALRADITMLDNVAPAAAQLALYQEIARVLLRVTAWLVRRDETGDINAQIERRKSVIEALDSHWLDLLSPYDSRRAETRIKGFVKRGVPEELSRRVAMLRARASGFDVAEFAKATDCEPHLAAHVFYDIGGRFKIDRLRNAALNFTGADHWESLAINRQTEQLYTYQGQLARRVMEGAKGSKSAKIIADWLASESIDIKAYDRAFASIADSDKGKPKWSLAKFTLASALLGQILEG